MFKFFSEKIEILQNLETEPHINKFPDIVGVFTALAHAKFYLSISGIVRLTDDWIGLQKFASYGDEMKARIKNSYLRPGICIPLETQIFLSNTRNMI